MRRFLLILPVSLLLATGCASAQSEGAQGATAELPSALPAPAVTRLQNPAPQRILFIGNSYMYFNDSLHNHVKRMVDAAGVHAESDLGYKSATIGGGALFDHNVDYLLDHENLRVDAPFQAVIMNGQSNAALTPERRAMFAEAAASHAAKIRAAGGEPVLYMTHAYVPPHRLARPDMINDVARLYIETGNETGALVIPVGLAFAEAYRRRPDIQLHKTYDGSHPSLLGTYLAAATVLASVYGVSPVGNEYDYFGEVAPEDARFLQEVALDTVQEFFGHSL